MRIGKNGEIGENFLGVVGIGGVFLFVRACSAFLIVSPLMWSVRRVSSRKKKREGVGRSSYGKIFNFP